MLISRHIHFCFKKSTFQKLWTEEFDVVDKTCRNRLRTKEDVSLYTIRDWQLFSGEFYPHKTKGELFFTASLSNNDEALEYMLKQKGKVICLNDSEDEENFEKHKQKVLAAFEKLLPEKSSFEV